MSEDSSGGFTVHHFPLGSAGGEAGLSGILHLLAQFTWLALACSQIYSWSPHPVRSLR